jgi:hypothetical protein
MRDGRGAADFQHIRAFNRFLHILSQERASYHTETTAAAPRRQLSQFFSRAPNLR